MSGKKSKILISTAFMLMCLTSCNKKEEVSLIQNEDAITIMNESDVVKEVVSLNKYDLFFPYQFPYVESDMDIQVVLHEDGTSNPLSLLRISEEKIKNYFVAFTFDNDAKSFHLNSFMSPHDKGSEGYLSTKPHVVSFDLGKFSTYFVDDYQIVNTNETQYLGVVDFTEKEYSRSNFQEEVKNSIENTSNLITLEVKTNDVME